MTAAAAGDFTAFPFAATALPVIRYTGTADSRTIPASARRFIASPSLGDARRECGRIGIARQSVCSIQSGATRGKSLRNGRWSIPPEECPAQAADHLTVDRGGPRPYNYRSPIGA